jgi:hypothetical protein
MERKGNLCIDVRHTPSLENAIEQWLTARDNLKVHPTDGNLHDYNATLYDLGAAWVERYPDDSNTAEAFEWYRRGLIAPEDE